MIKNSFFTINNQEPAVKIKIGWFLFFYWLVFCSLLFFVFFIKASSELDPDLGWHLRIGQEILSQKQVPHLESHTYPTLGTKWVDHEWLSNVLVYLIYSSGGNYGNWFLSFVFSALALSTFFVVAAGTRAFLLPSISFIHFSFLISLPIFASLQSIMDFFGNRLQVVSWLFLSALFYFFAKIFVQKSYRLFILFPPLFFIWANLHGSFVFGLVALGIFCFVFLFEKTTAKQKMAAVSTVILSFLATLLTPYHIELWKLVAGEYLSSRSYLSGIAEWRPSYAPPNILWLPSLYLSFFIALFFLANPKKIFARKGVFFYCLFCFLMLFLAIQSRRFMPFFCFASLPLMALFLKNIFQNFQPSKKVFVFLLSFFAFFSFLLYVKHAPAPKDIFAVQSPFSPAQAVSFLKQDPSLRDLQLFNEYAWGGYLLWTWPEKQIFIDGRMPQKPLSDGTAFFEEYSKFLDEKTLESKLEEYSIELALIPNEKDLSFSSKFEEVLYKKLFLLEEKDLQPKDHLKQHLEDKWTKIYEDEISLIFVLP